MEKRRQSMIALLVLWWISSRVPLSLIETDPDFTVAPSGFAHALWGPGIARETAKVRAGRTRPSRDTLAALASKSWKWRGPDVRVMAFGYLPEDRLAGPRRWLENGRWGVLSVSAKWLIFRKISAPRGSGGALPGV